MNTNKDNKKIILIELNELTPALMDKFMKSGRLPNFEKFRNESLVYQTEAAEGSSELEPWIQWVTVHTGLNYEDHKILRLNEGHTLESPRLWDIFSKAGKQSLVFGSMNGHVQPGFKGWFLPDPWCTEAKPSKELEDFFKFIQKNVLEYSNDQIPLTKKDYAVVLKFLGTHGLSINTISDITKQLIEDRSGNSMWKRAVLLDRILFDVFKWYWNKHQPSFSTFFANSTAHFQHSYWRNMEPELFENKPANNGNDEYADAIQFGYEKMDNLIARFIDLADDNTILAFSTALSQQPCLKYEGTGGAFFHRPRDLADFLKFAGISEFESIAPVMTHQFHVDFRNETEAVQAARILSSFKIDSQSLFEVNQTGTRVFTGCDVYHAIDLNLDITSDVQDIATPMKQFFYRMDISKSGMHHPIGMLWVRHPDRKHAIFAEKMPLSHVGQYLLDNFSLSLSKTEQAM
jgi:hypothetical protein